MLHFNEKANNLTKNSKVAFHFRFYFKDIAEQQNAYIKLLNDNLDIENNLELFYSANNYTALLNNLNDTSENFNYSTPSMNDSKILNLTE